MKLRIKTMALSILFSDSLDVDSVDGEFLPSWLVEFGHESVLELLLGVARGRRILLGRSGLGLGGGQGSRASHVHAKLFSLTINSSKLEKAKF